MACGAMRSRGRSVDLAARDKAARIKESVTMYELLQREGLRLNKANKMLCPLHYDKDTLSFGVYDGGRRWHCFGCQKSGSVIDFVMAFHHINFDQAIVRLNSMFTLGLANEKYRPNLYSEQERRRFDIVREIGKQLRAERLALQLGFIAEYRLWGSAYLITDDPAILGYANKRMEELDYSIDLIEEWLNCGK
jgi:DNA primase